MKRSFLSLSALAVLMLCSAVSPAGFWPHSFRSVFPDRSTSTTHNGPDAAHSFSPPEQIDGRPVAAFGRVYQSILHLRTTTAAAESDNGVSDRRRKRLQRRLADAERRFRFPVGPRSSAAGSPRVHAVGVYEPAHKDSPVHVQVQDTSGPIVLVLTAYSETTWSIQTGDEVRIDAVLMTGYHQQHLTNPPPGVPVLFDSYDQNSGDYAYAYGSDLTQWKAMRDYVRRRTGGLELQSCLGNYTAEPSYLIGSENVAWRMQMLDLQLHGPRFPGTAASAPPQREGDTSGDAEAVE